MVHEDEDEWVDDNLDQVDHIGRCMQASLFQTVVKSIHQDVRKMEQCPGNGSCQHHEDKDVFFPAFIIDIGFHLDLDHHGSARDEKDREEDAEVGKKEKLKWAKTA